MFWFGFVYSSVLTVAILKKRYLAQVKSDSLSAEARLYLKEVVQKELMKMLVISFVIFEDFLHRDCTLNLNSCCILHCVYYFLLSGQ